jgi:uncharacterized protein YuzE
MNRTVTIGHWTFDHISYDEQADVAYLSIGTPRRAVGEQTPEGHVALFDEDTGEFCGLTIIGIKRIITGAQPDDVTIPSPQQINSQELSALVCA